MASSLKAALYKATKHLPSPGRKSEPNGDARPQSSGDSSSNSSRVSKERERRQKAKEKDEKEKREVEEKEHRGRQFKEKYERDPAKPSYGNIPHNGRAFLEKRPKASLADVDSSRIDDIIIFRARIHHSRPMGAKLCFLLFRQNATVVQGVVTATEDEDVSELMVRFCESLQRESIVLVEGVVKKAEQEVKSADRHDVEIEVKRLYVISQVTHGLPFNVGDAGRPLDDARDGLPSLSTRTKLEHRMLDLRTAVNKSIFRIQAAMSKYARQYLEERDFLEIHSAKLQSSATESGASVFRVDYFKRAAFLAQSPQAGKEIAISADFERVYEIGPVFRAENSNTARHMTEFTGLDIEMALDTSYDEARLLVDGMLKHVFRSVQKNNAKDIEVVKTQFPHEDFVFPEETVVLKFSEGIKLLRDDGWGMDEEKHVDELEDLSTPAEIRLGELVKEKFNADYYILDKFPRSARPFYAMPDPDDPNLTNSWDFFCRGQEILSGGQRLHDAVDMEKSMHDNGIEPTDMQDYVDAYRYGIPPHAGAGIGLERLVMLFLKLGNLRLASLFPRDPKSFADSPSYNATSASSQVLPVPAKGIPAFDEPTVLSKDELKKEEHPGLPDLIAKYGDSTNTAWTDPAYEIWRWHENGAAVGFIDSKGYAVTWGKPLCEPKDLPEVITDYLKWLEEERKLKPVWLAADDPTQRFLADEFRWRVLSVITEQRVQFENPEAVGDKNVLRKREKAEKEGLKYQMIENEITPELQAEIEVGIRAWQDSREGTQIHTTGVRPFADAEHRTYFIARDADDEIVGLVVLAQLGKPNGYQIKWSLAFPGAPKGTSEYLLSHVMEEMQKAGVPTATFGVGASDTMKTVENLGGIRSKWLADAYGVIAKSFHLTNKSDYRRKFGVTEQDVYVCYPKHGLGFRGIDAIVSSVRDPEKNRKKSDGAQSSGSSQTSGTLLRDLGFTKTGLKGAPSDVAGSTVNGALSSRESVDSSTSSMTSAETIR